MNVIFDIETDGLYDQCTRIHCVGIQDVETGETFVYNDQGTKPPISQAITLLETVDYAIGHNIINYDVPMIQKFYPWFTPPRLLDTLVMGRIIHPDIKDLDFKRRWKSMPLQLYGRHSLEAYGYRLGMYKGDFCHHTDWKDWSAEMEAYMEQDLRVTDKLWLHFQRFLTT
jgi:hypothetical protein